MLLKLSDVQSPQCRSSQPKFKAPSLLSLHTNQTHSSCPVTSPSPSTKFFNLAPHTQAMSDLHLFSSQRNSPSNVAQSSSNSTIALNSSHRIAQCYPISAQINKFPNSTHPIARCYLIAAQFNNSPSLSSSNSPTLLNLCPNRQLSFNQIVNSSKLQRPAQISTS